MLYRRDCDFPSFCTIVRFLRPVWIEGVKLSVFQVLLISIVINWSLNSISVGLNFPALVRESVIRTLKWKLLKPPIQRITSIYLKL